ncbi:hypothetical protein QL996_13380 [Planococcus sp. APC 4015]|nr:hypothetical protein [Planococcus sp. APC 4015]
MGEALLDGYRVPPLSESHLILRHEAWDLLADIDQLQADLAGSRTWDRGEDGRALRSEMRQACETLSIRADEIGLKSASVRLVELGELFDDPVL